MTPTPHIVLAVEEINNIHGGVERTVVNLANFLVTQNFKVTLLTFEHKQSGTPVYKLNPHVQRCDLSLINPKPLTQSRNNHSTIKEKLPPLLTEVIRNIKATLRAITIPLTKTPRITKALQELNADAIISFKTHFHRWIIPAAIKANLPIIASDHNPPDILYHHYICAFDRWITYHLLRKANALRVLIPPFIKNYPAKIQPLCTAIGNGFDVPPHPLAKPDANKIILNIGRLYFQKDQETLIKAFAQISQNHPDWQLHIYGDGPLEEELRKLIKQLNASKQIKLMGPTNDITSCYKNAALFAMPSLFEGFGNVTLEAMAHGLPVIGYNNIEANNYLIDDQKTGLLIEANNRIETMAQALKSLMNAPETRKRMGLSAYEKAQKFDKNQVMEQWKKLILKASQIS